MKQYGYLGWGAALGAGAVGAGSIGMDLLRKKKREAEGKPAASVKKALLLSMGLGIPLGVAMQLAGGAGINSFRTWQVRQKNVPQGSNTSANV